MAADAADEIPLFADPDAPAPTMTDAELAAYDRRERRANAAIARKTKQIHTELLRLERFALRHGIFMEDHQPLQASIHYLEWFLSIYDSAPLPAYQPNPFASEARPTSPQRRP